MPPHLESCRKAKPAPGLPLLPRFLSAAAALFALAGLVMLYGARDYIPPLAQPDPVFGLSTRTVLLLAGLLHLAVSGCLFAMRDPMTQGLVASWAGLNSIVYLAGVAWLKPAGSLPVVVVVAWELGVREKTVAIGWGLFIVYLVTVGLWLVVLEWRRLKQIKLDLFLRHWREGCERGVAFVRQSGPKNSLVNRTSPHGDSPMLPASKDSKTMPATFKFSCPSCGQHIQCEFGYSSRRISCPTCHNQLVVPQPPPG